jgi:signal recognition particle receptor subunit beta
MVPPVQFNLAQHEVIFKLVYYGPPLSGKTTNLKVLHKLLGGASVGELTVLDTADDRTLFFDLLPLTVRAPTGYQVKIKVFTVPGQIIHAATRRIVLSGADGLAFIADSQRSSSALNNEFWHGMRRYLSDNGLDPRSIPCVIQFNKRDLKDVRSDQEIDQVRERGPEPVFKAVAVRGEGVLETFEGLLTVLFTHLNRRYDIDKKLGLSCAQLLAMLVQPAPRDAEARGQDVGALP